MNRVRIILTALAVLSLVPCAWAASQAVGLDGRVYSVGVVEMEAGASTGATALAYSVLHPGGQVVTGFVSPTEDLSADREPSLVLFPGEEGPFLVWTRNDGTYDQIAFSRYTGTLWTEMQYMTSDAQDHLHPQAGVDSRGTAYVVWVESSGGGSVAVATFDPRTGTLLTGPRDLLRELMRLSPPEWLGQDPVPRTVDPGKPGMTIEPVPEGGNDTPAIPPGAENSHPKSGSSTHLSGGATLDAIGPRALGLRKSGLTLEPVLEGGNDTPAIPPGAENSHLNADSLAHLSGGVTLDAACPLAVATVAKGKALHIGVLEDGVVLKYYRSALPPGAPEAYPAMLQRVLLDQHCRP